MIKAVIFDFGGVIIGGIAEARRKWEEKLGLPPGSLGKILYESEAWALAEVGKISTADYWRLTAPKLGLNSKEELEDFLRGYFAKERLDKGVVELAKRLKKRYKVALLSNASDVLEDALRSYGISDLFDLVVNSARVGVAKPDERIFLLTLERLGVKPYEAILIDDNDENVEKASSLGIHAIRFTAIEELERELKAKLDFDDE
jgi:putative hydrolase of the HAD superfamily